jgi:hypothetical protein
MRQAFRRRGHAAWSCDLKPTRDGSQFHIQADVRRHLERAPDGQKWDLAIFHPDCTYFTNSAAWAFKDGPYHQKVKPGTLVGAARRERREIDAAFVRELRDCPIPRKAIENPIGYLSTVLGTDYQIIQPHQFGDDASKATCLWLYGLPRLVPTKHIAPRIVNGRPRWANQTDGGQNKLTPSDDRAMLRAATYPGIADACADQWTNIFVTYLVRCHVMDGAYERLPRDLRQMRTRREGFFQFRQTRQVHRRTQVTTKYELVGRDGKIFGPYDSILEANRTAKEKWPDQNQDEDHIGDGWDIQIAGLR